MTKGSDQPERIEDILEQVAKSLQEMAARQQHHDEAFERHITEMKLIREAIAADAVNIQRLLNAELRHRRLTDLEGGDPV